MSLSFFARDFVDSSAVAPEIWQAINPFFVITLTPIVMALFAWLSRRGKEISTPRKIAIGMFIAGLAFLFLVIYSALKGYPSADYSATLSNHLSIPNITPIDIKHTAKNTAQHCQMGQALYIRGPIHNNKLPNAVAPNHKP